MKEILNSSGLFPTTMWSQIRIASDHQHEFQNTQLEFVLKKYLPLLSHYLRYVRKIPASEVDDLIQAFVLEKIVEENFFSKADRSKGRLRTFLIRSLSNFVTTQQRDYVRKSGHIEKKDASSDHDFASSPSSTNPVHQFEKIWGQQVIREALHRMRLHYIEKQREDIWGIFLGRVIQPVFGGGEAVPYEELVATHGCESPKQVCNILVNSKRMFAKILHQVLEDYNLDGDTAEVDIAEIRKAVSHGGQVELLAIDHLLEELSL